MRVILSHPSSKLTICQITPLRVQKIKIKIKIKIKNKKIITSAFALQELVVDFALFRQLTAFRDVACPVEILSLPLANNPIEDR